ncbi:MAG: hypothetical protein Q9159_003652 [Coniocarpon cinnabarinum]
MMAKTLGQSDIEHVDAKSFGEDIGGQQSLKLDPHGFPLRPQPSADPLAYVPSAKALHISVKEASYQTTVPILLAGVSPILWAPLSNIYGRRPIYIAVTALGIAALAGTAAAPHWSGILTARAFMGIGTSAGMGIGAATVADLYYMHERGRYAGIYVIFVTNGAHISAVVGGFIAKDIGWRWTAWVPCVILAANWVLNVFCLPETLYHRPTNTTNHIVSRTDAHGSWLRLFNFTAVHIRRRPRLMDFLSTFRMLQYPSVVLPAIYYSVSFGFGSVMFAVSGAPAFSEIYDFGPSQVGLCIGLGTFTGTLIGELTAGPVSDRILYLATKRNGGVPVPEARLQGTWPALLLLPAGIIIEGVCFQYETHWMGPVCGMAIANFGLQIASTGCYAYVTDCYKPQSSEISTLLNFGRQVFSFPLGFYLVPFATATTWGVAWAVLAIINAVTYSGIILLMWRGRRWREMLGSPAEEKEEEE